MSVAMAVATAAPLSMRQILLPVAALLVGVAFLYAGQGLQSTLVPLRAESEDFSAFQVGLLGSFYFAGFVVGCVFAPRIILQAGHIRAFAAMVSLASAAAIAFPVVVEAAAWNAARFVIGFCLAGLFIIIESWLNEKSTNETRGIVMSTYVILTFLMITAGQMTMTAFALDSFKLFAVASILFSLAAVPVALTRQTQPAPIAVVRFRPWRLYAVAPAAFVGALLIGMSNGVFWSLAPVFVTREGHGTDGAAIFMSVAVMAGAVSQYPLGRLSDFIDRRRVLILAMLVGTLAGVLLWQSSGLGFGVLLAFGALFGAATLPAYSLAAAHAYDWAQGDEMVETSAAFVLLFGIGSVIGPFVTPFVMHALGTSAMFLATAGMNAALVVFTLVRILQRTAPSEKDKNDFDIYSTAPTGAALTPDPIDADMPMIEVPDWPQPAEDEADDGDDDGFAASGARLFDVEPLEDEGEAYGERPAGPLGAPAPA